MEFLFSGYGTDDFVGLHSGPACLRFSNPLFIELDSGSLLVCVTDELVVDILADNNPSSLETDRVSSPDDGPCIIIDVLWLNWLENSVVLRDVLLMSNK